MGPNLQLLSWNVNGLRAVYKKGFLDFLKADVVCLQEIKAFEAQLPFELKALPGYNAFFCSAEKAGYSGVAIYTKEQPIHVSRGFGIPRFDSEGRVLIAEYRDFILLNIYFPNGRMSSERLNFKMDFYDEFLRYADELKASGKRLVICGDFNTAHREIDLARPNENSTTSGFLPIERAWVDKFVSHGYVDTFRMFEKAPGNYTYWDMKTRARERNVGWRIDYFFVSESLMGSVKDAFIMPEVLGSDHCPIGLSIAVR